MNELKAVLCLARFERQTWTTVLASDPGSVGRVVQSHEKSIGCLKLKL